MPAERNPPSAPAASGSQVAPGDPATLFTVGHSNHELSVFLGLLQRHGITAIADVRSQPYSQFNPQFNRETLENVLKARGILYGFMGKELGARRSEAECYVEGQARYELVARTPAFQRGLDRIRRAAPTQRLALMCSEKDPITCHRMVLICRHLGPSGADPALTIRHILEDGSVETTDAAEDRLLDLLGLPPVSLFQGRAEMVEQAYEQQGRKIAYVEESTPDPAAG